METQGSKAIDIQFQQDIQHLGLLSQSEENLDGFIEAYRLALEANYNSMIQCGNVNKLLEGVYQSRVVMLKAILQRQLDHFGLEWPDDTRLSQADQ